MSSSGRPAARVGTRPLRASATSSQNVVSATTWRDEQRCRSWSARMAQQLPPVSLAGTGMQGALAPPLRADQPRQLPRRCSPSVPGRCACAWRWRRPPSTARRALPCALMYVPWIVGPARREPDPLPSLRAPLEPRLVSFREGPAFTSSASHAAPTPRSPARPRPFASLGACPGAPPCSTAGTTTPAAPWRPWPPGRASAPCAPTARR